MATRKQKTLWEPVAFVVAAVRAIIKSNTEQAHLIYKLDPKHKLALAPDKSYTRCFQKYTPIKCPGHVPAVHRSLIAYWSMMFKAGALKLSAADMQAAQAMVEAGSAQTIEGATLAVTVQRGEEQGILNSYPAKGTHAIGVVADLPAREERRSKQTSGSVADVVSELGL